MQGGNCESWKLIDTIEEAMRSEQIFDFLIRQWEIKRGKVDKLIKAGQDGDEGEQDWSTERSFHGNRRRYEVGEESQEAQTEN
ncbi:hypothetical protein U1Q18_038329 [Sarracenia purpurea var. burkii]